MNEAQIEQYMEKFQEKRRRAETHAAEVARAGLSPDVDYMVFSVGGDEFAVPMASLQATMALPKCTPVPFVGEKCRGIIHVRGQIVSVTDLRIVMKVEPSDMSETTLIVLEHAGEWRGFVVDSLNRALTVRTDDELQPVTKFELDRLFESGSP